MVEYKHGLSEGLLRGLEKIGRAGVDKPINLKELALTRNQWDNFQKLRYWGLVVQSSSGKLKSGIWAITQTGMDFLRGKVSRSKSVWTYRGEFRRFEGDPVFIQSIIEGYKFQEDYYEESIPHHVENPNQQQLPLA